VPQPHLKITFGLTKKT